MTRPLGLTGVMTRFRRMFGLEPEADVDHELAFHVEMRVRELVARGETPDRARELALSRFGDYGRSRQECLAINERRRRRLTRTERFMELRQDIWYALRLLRRSPGFTAVALLTLALGIGATSAIFSVVDGVLLQSLPFRDAARLYHVNMLYPDGTEYRHSSAPDFMSLRESTRTFEQVEASSTSIYTMLGAGDAREVRGAAVTNSLFAMLGLRVEHGRGFLPEEHQPGQARAAILDHGYWLREFGGDRSVLGRSVTLRGISRTIVGIMAPGARLSDAISIYVPIEYSDTFSAATAKNRRGEFLAVIGRARPGIDAAAVDRDVKRIGADLQRAFPDTNGALTFSSTPLADTVIGDVRAPLYLLMGAVGFVLLVACANVANLLLARASVRQAELAVRAALGAGRMRLLRQLLTEALVLGLAGGALGLGLAFAGTRLLVAAQPADIPRLDNVGVNPGVVLFTAAVAVLCSVVIGVLPALQSTGGRLTSGLRDGRRGTGPGRAGQRVRSALVVAEMALTVVLLMGAGLLIRSFVQMTRVDPGFRPEHAMVFRVAMQGEAYATGATARQRVADIETRLRALPGVVAVGASSTLPAGGRGSLVGFGVEGAPPPPSTVNAEIGLVSTTPGYFNAIGARLERGRALEDGDTATSPRVTVINAAAARFWFPQQDPIGRRVIMNGTPYQVVGIVADILQSGPEDPVAPGMFVPLAQRTTGTNRFVVRTAGDPSGLAPAIRTEVRALDANLPIEALAPLDSVLSASMARPRFYVSLLTLFAAAALALAATGIFGVMSYTVAQRAREISIRLALGAQGNDVLHLIATRAAVLAGAGLALGIAGALALQRVISAQLFGVSALDPATLSAVVFVLAASAGLATLVPVLRAMRLDPAAALREG